MQLPDHHDELMDDDMHLSDDRDDEPMDASMPDAPIADRTHLSGPPLITSFNISQSFAKPTPGPAPPHSPLAPVLPLDVTTSNCDIVYDIKSGSQRCGTVLADNLGYTYT